MQQQYFYQTFTDDVVKSPHQKAQLPADFSWAPTPLRSAIVNPMATGFAKLYRRSRNIQIIGAEQLVPGAFIYANHTQPIGDVFVPRTLPYPVAILAGPANLGLPLLGKLLPYGRALLLPRTRRQYPQFLSAIKRHQQAGELLLIYPEAHVWPYYSGIRPFDATSFHYPVRLHAPVFTMTTTYQPGRWPHTVRQTIYLDGPLPTDPQAAPKVQQQQLHQAALAQLQTRSRLTTFTGVTYTHTLEDEHD